MASQQEQDEKLEYAARLSGLLLNEATDVMRWFMLDNLPRSVGEDPDLSMVLRKNRRLFASLRDKGTKHRGQIVLGHEMFDILFPPHGIAINVDDLEIKLIFVLIRYICKIKQPDWKWWDETPQAHQTTSVFDVIRIVRFVDRMTGVVHDYEVTEEYFEKSFNHLMCVIARLRGYKISARRWKGDVVTYQEDESVTKDRKAVNLVVIMRWQTLPTEERDATYLVMKENFYKECRDASRASSAWEVFASCFGQMKYFKICEANELKAADEGRMVKHKANNLLKRDYLEATTSPAKQLNWGKVQDENWKTYVEAQHLELGIHESSPDSVAPTGTSLTAMERRIYDFVDNRVFIKEDCEESQGCLAMVREGWKKEVIMQNSQIPVFPWGKADKIHLDNVSIRLAHLSKVGDTPLESWTDILYRIHDNCLRVAIQGEPCSGKTTVLRKIHFDIATKNLTEIQPFDLVFYIDLSTVRKEKPYTRIADCIIRQCLGDTHAVTADELEDIMNSRNGRGVLFLFDNADQVDDEDEMSEIRDVIKSYMWPLCGMIATSTSENRCLDTEARLHFGDTSTESKITWETYRTIGFTSSDVKNEVGRVFKEATIDKRVDVARHVTNLIRVYHRDLYTNGASPILVTILCHTWMRLSNNTGDIGLRNYHRNPGTECLPETMGAILKEVFSRPPSPDSVSNFSASVLRGTLASTRTTRFRRDSEKDAQVDALLKKGILLREKTKESPEEETVRFAHPLLQSYISSRVYISKACPCDLGTYMDSIESALRIKDFLVFCCEGNAHESDEILERLASLSDEVRHTASSVISDEFIRLCMLCFYVSPRDSGSTGHCDATRVLKARWGLDETTDEIDDMMTDVITANLVLDKLNSMSSKMKESLLGFVRACRPPLAQSGTVFPLMHPPGLPRGTSCIRCLVVDGLSTGDTTLVASVISNLPFLEEITLHNLEGITSADFAKICCGLKPSDENVTSVLHSLTISFKALTRFDTPHLFSFQPLAAVLPHLPYLEMLHINPLTYTQFTSLYVGGNNTIVPIKNVAMPNLGISEAMCADMASCVSRSKFLEVFDISHNPIRNGLTSYGRAFSDLGYLREMNLEQCCLSSRSLNTLGRALSATKMSQTLIALNLRGNHVDDQTALLNIASSIGHLRALQKLDLSENFLRNRIICVLAKALSKLHHLRELRLDYVQMGDVGFSALKSNIANLGRLEVLSVGANPLGESALETLGDFLGNDNGCTSVLREIRISGISEEITLKISKKSISVLATCLLHLKRLESLDLRHIVMQRADVMKLLHSAEQHQNLREIILTDALTPIKEMERRPWKCLVCL